jgi:hypothetical protein
MFHLFLSGDKGSLSYNDGHALYDLVAANATRVDISHEAGGLTRAHIIVEGFVVPASRKDSDIDPRITLSEASVAELLAALHVRLHQRALES